MLIKESIDSIENSDGFEKYIKAIHAAASCDYKLIQNALLFCLNR